MPLWLACRSLGIALMPVDAGTPTAEIAALARRFGATIAILPGSTAGVDALGTATPFESPLVAVTLADATPAPQIYRGAAALKVTSGSTGLPKATFTREDHLVADTAHITTALDIRPQDCQIAAIPISHAYGLGHLVMPLAAPGDGRRFARSVHPAALARRRDGLQGPRVSRCPVHVCSLREQPGRHRLAARARDARQRRRAARSDHGECVRSNVRRQGSLFLWHKRKRRYLLRRLAGCRSWQPPSGAPCLESQLRFARTKARRSMAEEYTSRATRSPPATPGSRRPMRDSRTGGS